MALPDNINIDCPHQLQKRGILTCNIAVKNLVSMTNEVNPEICNQCDIGKIYRNFGCDCISGKIHIYESLGKFTFEIQMLWCEKRKRETAYDCCLKCACIGTQFTAPILKATLDYFQELGFGSAKENLEKAREHLHGNDPSGSITHSISAIESTFKSILDIFKKPYPTKEQITTLWKSVKDTLHLGDEVAFPHLINLLGSLSGCLSALGGLRNDLSDAHGKGLIPCEVYNSYAELALNISSTICLFIIRRYQELKLKKNNDLIVQDDQR